MSGIFYPRWRVAVVERFKCELNMMQTRKGVSQNSKVCLIKISYGARFNPDPTSRLKRRAHPAFLCNTSIPCPPWKPRDSCWKLIHSIRPRLYVSSFPHSVTQKTDMMGLSFYFVITFLQLAAKRTLFVSFTMHKISFSFRSCNSYILLYKNYDNKPWAYICSKRLFAGLLSGELISGGVYYWREFCFSKWVGLDNKASLKH